MMLTQFAGLLESSTTLSTKDLSMPFALMAITGGEDLISRSESPGGPNDFVM